MSDLGGCRFFFTPKEDITLRELADILEACGLHLSEGAYRSLDRLTAQRHFTEEER